MHSLFCHALGTRRPTALGAYSIATSYAKAADAVGCQVKGLATQSLIRSHFPPRRQPEPRGFPPAHVRTFRVDRGVHSHHLTTQPVAPTQQDLARHAATGQRHSYGTTHTPTWVTLTALMCTSHTVGGQQY